MNRLYSFLSLFTAFLVSSVSLISCVDPISINPGAGETQLAVDGSIVYDSSDVFNLKKDTIKLLYSVPYTDNSTKLYENAAVVTVKDSILGFTDTLLFVNNGVYRTQNLVPRVGGIYVLNIKLPNGELYRSVTAINRPAVFKDLSVIEKERDTNLPNGPIAAGPYINMEVIDLAGLGDAYRIKYYVKRNPVVENPYYVKNPGSAINWNYYNQTANIRLISESEFQNSGVYSSVADERQFDFITTIAINQLESDRSRPGFYKGDSVRVEVYSLTKDNFFFWARLYQELDLGSGGGFSGLTARPVANVPTNIIGVNTTKKALGWFSGCAKVSKQVQIPLDASFVENQGL